MPNLEPADEYLRRYKRFEKKKARELAAVLDNLDTFVKGLNDGLKLEQVRTFGFVHREPDGLLAIDQKGGGYGAKLAQTRLYVYVDVEATVIHLITIGDKSTQREDIRLCREFVKELRQKEDGTHEREKTIP